LRNITKLKKEKKKKKSIDNIQYNTSIIIEIKKKEKLRDGYDMKRSPISIVNSHSSAL
jgi:hypothetical protein